MKRRSTAASIDIGSTKVTVIVGDVGDLGETRVLGVGVAPAAGLSSRGVIDNIQSAREAVGIAVEKAEHACADKDGAPGVAQEEVSGSGKDPSQRGRQRLEGRWRLGRVAVGAFPHLRT